MRQDIITKALVKGVKTGRIIAKVKGWNLTHDEVSRLENGGRCFIGANGPRMHAEDIVYSLPS